MTSILGWAAILSDGKPDRETVATAADSIKQSAKSQQYLVEELLDVSRIVFEKFHIDLRPVDLVPLA